MMSKSAVLEYFLLFFSCQPDVTKYLLRSISAKCPSLLDLFFKPSMKEKTKSHARLLDMVL